MFFNQIPVNLPSTVTSTSTGTSTSTSSTNDMFSASAFIAENLANATNANATNATINSNAAAAAPVKKVKSSTDKTKTLLPVDFEPSEYSVICGNKRTYFNSVGNRRFRVICKMHAKEFLNAESKHEKSFVVSTVMKTLKDACPVGAFVAFENGRWWQCSERTSREKVGTFFRDLAGAAYKSSSKNKIAQRRIKRSQCSDLSSSTGTSTEQEDTTTTMPTGISKPAAVSRRAISAPISSTTSLHELFTATSNSNNSNAFNNTSNPLSSLEQIMRASSCTAPSLLPAIAQLQREQQPQLENFESIISGPLLFADNNNNNDTNNQDDDHSTASSSGASFYDVDDLMPCAL
ncbi:Nitrilase family, member 2 [Seminavis robusta]|uniref:Nitrilase family, member 2 n=1 Tax=Seminavis robusta TaxID=568900 RepID=A0A9N8H0L6_9STRA|nr:Nitrilase family, member 2 [Seminavis robusta]|eukprot:Sro23_g015620.1 Nitrilase family, member 2 (348) ;mRNA; r:30271-31314